MLRAGDIEGLYAIIPTPATSEAARPDATGTVDLDETARLVTRLIEDGASGIIAVGTTGECPTLSGPDYRTLVDCLVETVGGRVPLFVGASSLGVHDVVRRLRYATGRGVTGTLLGLPMWQPLSVPMAVRFYADIAELFPALAIMVYANSRAFRFGFPAEFWESIARDVPTVCAAKVSHGDGLAALYQRTRGRIHFLPNESRIHEFHAACPEQTTALWATAASMGPGPALGIYDAVRADDQPLIDQWARDIALVHEPIAPLIRDSQVFASYNIQIEKVRISEAGYCRPGPCRPPYDEIPPDYEAAARACGRRWRSLDERTRHVTSRLAATASAVTPQELP
jgi:trans-o-hydroxybenzylidenepyruvate hydratase-aldolase